MADPNLMETDELREEVRRRYAEAAKAVQGETDCGCGASLSMEEREVFGATLYAADERAEAEAALEASLGCGNPTVVAELRKGEIVLDLGSGAGGDVLLSARRVGPAGRAYGLDMTDEMLSLARRHATEAGIDNVEFVKGQIESIPLDAGTIDVIISNCVVNLSADKGKVFAEAARVLRPEGRLAITDVVADEDMDEATRHGMQQWTGCIAGALTRDQYEQHLVDAGLTDIEVTKTHRVHQHAASAVIRARKPAVRDCCEPAEQVDCCEPAAKNECCDSSRPTDTGCGCR